MHEAGIDSHSRRVTIGALIFVLCCLVSSVRLVVMGAKAKDSNEVARRSDQRFGALKASLPARGVVGYVGEPGDSAVGDYYLAEYALAPLVVDHSPNHEWVVGNFPKATPPTVPEQNLQLVKDFGNGVLLFRTGAPAR